MSLHHHSLGRAEKCIWEKWRCWAVPENNTLWRPWAKSYNQNERLMREREGARMRKRGRMDWMDPVRSHLAYPPQYTEWPILYHGSQVDLGQDPSLVPSCPGFIPHLGEALRSQWVPGRQRLSFTLACLAQCLPGTRAPTHLRQTLWFQGMAFWNDNAEGDGRNYCLPSACYVLFTSCLS